MKAVLGTLFVVTALATGYWECFLMMRQVIGAPGSAWYPLTLGASIVLLSGGILTLFPATRVVWLVAIAILIPFALCVPLGVTWPCMVFSLATGLATWGAFALATTFNRMSLVPLFAGVALAAWWIPEFAYSIVGSARGPVSPALPDMLFGFGVVVLVLASASAGVALLRTPRVDRHPPRLKA